MKAKQGRAMASALLLACGVLSGCSGGGGGGASPTAPPAATDTAAAEAREMTMRLLPPSPAAPGAGDGFTVVVEVSGAADLAAYQFTPSYDPAVVELVSITDLGFLASTGRTATCDQSGAAPEPVTFYCVTLGASLAGPSGEGNLAVLQFRALAAGTAEIALAGAAATTPDGGEIIVRVEGVAVSVGVAPATPGDGQAVPYGGGSHRPSATRSTPIRVTGWGCLRRTGVAGRQRAGRERVVRCDRGPHGAGAPTEGLRASVTLALIPRRFGPQAMRRSRQLRIPWGRRRTSWLRRTNRTRSPRMARPRTPAPGRAPGR